MDKSKIASERAKARHDFTAGLAEALVEHYGHKIAANMGRVIQGRIDYMYYKHRKDVMAQARYRIIYTNCYARSLIAVQTGLRMPEIPKELGELKQIQLSIKRLIKENKNEQHRRSKKRTRCRF